MLRGPLSRSDFRGQFSGHETFPLRHLWLRKAYDAVASHPLGAPRSLFSEPRAIVTFGVGKNMAVAIRHWSLACNIIKEEGEFFVITPLGRFLFDETEGRDPFMEFSATAWFIHWMVAGSPERTTTWFYAFNHFPEQIFDWDMLATPILDLCRERGWSRTSTATIKRDVECFIRSYVPRTEAKFSDDNMEPVLAELGLIRPHGNRSFQFRRGPKPSLPDGVFLYAVDEFWKRYAPDQGTMSIESLAYEPGAPGRVFKLDEFSLIERLSRIDETSRGLFTWSDTAGVRNVARKTVTRPLALLDLAYGRRIRKEAA